MTASPKTPLSMREALFVVLVILWVEAALAGSDRHPALTPPIVPYSALR